MRSRPALELQYTPRNPRPGQRVHFEAILTGRSRTPIDRVTFAFRGREQRQRTSGKYPTEVVHDWFDLRAESDPLVLGPGERIVVPAELDLPAWLPPAFKSSVSRISYLLEVRVEIPWWPDRTARYRIPVRPSPAPAVQRVADVLTTKPRSHGVHLELTVADARHVQGTTLAGAVSVESFGGSAVRRLEVVLVALDVPLAPGQVGYEEIFRSKPVVVTAQAPEPGISYPFRVALPGPPAPPSFEGKVVAVRWFLEACAVVKLGNDVVLRTEVQLVPPAKGSAPRAGEEKAAARIAPLGRERRALIWAAVARRTGLELDADAETMSGTAGVVGLTVMLEPRDGRLSAVADLKWPPLGLGLQIRERRWRGNKPFDQRFGIAGRSPHQLNALLTEKVRGLLQGFDRLVVDDEGAELGSTASAVHADVLTAFVKAAQKTAVALDAAFAAIPAPDPLGPHSAAWRAYAESLGGVFQPGGFAIRAATYKGAPVELVTHFDAAGRPEATRVRALLPERRPPTAEAKKVMASLARELDGLQLADDAVEARLPCPLPDPARAESVWRAMARVVKVL